MTDIAVLNERERVAQEIRRSNVRIYITYILTWAYVLGVGGVLAYTIFEEAPSQLTLGILAGLSSASLGVIGFWFGGRKLDKETQQTAQAPVPAGKGPTPVGTPAPTPNSQAGIVQAKAKMATLMPAGPPARRSRR